MGTKTTERPPLFVGESPSGTETPSLGLAVDCSWYSAPAGDANDARRLIHLAVRPTYGLEGPILLDFDRPHFLEQLSGSIHLTPDVELLFETPDEATPAIQHWLAEPEVPAATSAEYAHVMGGLGHNADAVYVVFFTRRTVGGRLLVEAVVNAYTSINRLSMTVQSIGEIDGPEDVRSLLKAAKIYARHLIVLNEAAR